MLSVLDEVVEGMSVNFAGREWLGWGLLCGMGTEGGAAVCGGVQAGGTGCLPASRPTRSCKPAGSPAAAHEPTHVPAPVPPASACPTLCLPHPCTADNVKLQLTYLDVGEGGNASGVGKPPALKPAF